MTKRYSTYEAKARLSELLNRVRRGDVITITHRGDPIAEVRPIEPAADDLARRLTELRRDGIISGRGKKHALRPLAKRPGAVRRFLRSREK